MLEFLPRLLGVCSLESQNHKTDENTVHFSRDGQIRQSPDRLKPRPLDMTSLASSPKGGCSQPASPSASGGVGVMGLHAIEVEEAQENMICDQWERTQYPSFAKVPSMPSLPGNGRYDKLLLSPGRSLELMMALPEIFKNDPVSDSCRQPQRTGQFHSFLGTYGQQVFSPMAVQQILGLAHDFWAQMPNVDHLVVPEDGRIILVGDTHGQLQDVLWIFFKYGFPTSVNQYLFIGDIVDRGSHALEILLLLFALKRDNRKSIHILRGNHEDLTANISFGFKSELESKFGAEGHGWILHTCAQTVYPLMPIAARVSDASRTTSICVVHGGIPVQAFGQSFGPVTLDRTIAGLDRHVSTLQQRSTTSEHIFFNLLWADPLKPGQHPMSHNNGRGNLFNEQDTAAFCRENRVACVVRAHQVPDDGRGVARLHSGRCVTVFSASNYCGSLNNYGGVIICDRASFAGGDAFAPEVCEHFAPPWPQLARQFQEHSVIEVTEHCASQLAQRQQRLQLARSLEQQHEPERRCAARNGRASLLQIEHFAVDQIVMHKRKLFQTLSSLDAKSTGVVSKSSWHEIMSQQLRDVPPVWLDLAQEWSLGEVVPYVQFLHRFQIVSDGAARENSKHVDTFAAMAQLRLSISDVQSDVLLRNLDADMNGQVTLDEFRHFLDSWQISIPLWQAAALFEAMCNAVRKSPTVDDIILGIALVSRSPAPLPCGQAWHNIAKQVGESIVSSGNSLVNFFRYFDANRDGFMEFHEFQRALQEGVPNFAAQLSPAQCQLFMQHIDSQGVQNGRISLVEFLRAVGSQQLEKDLAQSLLGELMKPLYFRRPALETIFQRFDPASSGCISLSQFQAGVKELQRQLNEEHGEALTDCQAQAICEIASGGQNNVNYWSFLQSLKAVDVQKRADNNMLGR